MPIYEYQCQDCNYYFDKLQKFSDPALVDCPECSKPKLQKLISAPSFQLKGSGWYETDFKDKKTSSESNSETNKPIAAKPTADKAGKSEQSKKPETQAKKE